MFRFRPDRIEDLFMKLKPILGEKKTNKLWILYHTSITQRKFIESLLYIWASKYLNETYEKKEVLLLPIPRDKAAGEESDFCLNQL